eukprot:jgi/Ulvmu1/2260/UM013_0107.1
MFNMACKLQLESCTQHAFPCQVTQKLGLESQICSSVDPMVLPAVQLGQHPSTRPSASLQAALQQLGWTAMPPPSLPRGKLRLGGSIARGGQAEVFEITSCDDSCVTAKDSVAKIFFDIDDETHDEIVAEAVALTASKRSARAVHDYCPTTNSCLASQDRHADDSSATSSPITNINSFFPLVELRGVIRKAPRSGRIVAGASRCGHEIQGLILQRYDTCLYSLLHQARKEAVALNKQQMSYASSRIIQQGPISMPVDDMLRILCDISLGLTGLHGQGILHCDLKSGNVLTRVSYKRGRFRLALPNLRSAQHALVISDLGKAQLPGRCRAYTTALGTRECRSPELAARDLPREFPPSTPPSTPPPPPLLLSYAQDIYALGGIAHELICPLPPLFSVNGTHEMLRRIAAGTAHIAGERGERAVDICPAIADLWLWACAPNPADRPTARAFHRLVSGTLADYVILRHCHREVDPAALRCDPGGAVPAREPGWLLARAEVRTLGRSAHVRRCGDAADAVVVAAGTARSGEVVTHETVGIIEHGGVMPSPRPFEGSFWPSLNIRIEEKIAHLKPPVPHHLQEEKTAAASDGTSEDTATTLAGAALCAAEGRVSSSGAEPAPRPFWQLSSGSSGIGWTGFGQLAAQASGLGGSAAAAAAAAAAGVGVPAEDCGDCASLFEALAADDEEQAAAVCGGAPSQIGDHGGRGLGASQDPAPPAGHAGALHRAPPAAARIPYSACTPDDSACDSVWGAAVADDDAAPWHVPAAATAHAVLSPEPPSAFGRGTFASDFASDSQRDSNRTRAAWSEDADGQAHSWQPPPVPRLWSSLAPHRSGDNGACPARTSAMTGSGRQSCAAVSARSSQRSASDDSVAQRQGASSEWGSERGAPQRCHSEEGLTVQVSCPGDALGTRPAPLAPAAHSTWRAEHSTWHGGLLDTTCAPERQLRLTAPQCQVYTASWPGGYPTSASRSSTGPPAPAPQPDSRPGALTLLEVTPTVLQPPTPGPHAAAAIAAPPQRRQRDEGCSRGAQKPATLFAGAAAVVRRVGAAVTGALGLQPRIIADTAFAAAPLRRVMQLLMWRRPGQLDVWCENYCRRERELEAAKPVTVDIGDRDASGCGQIGAFAAVTEGQRATDGTVYLRLSRSASVSVHSNNVSGDTNNAGADSSNGGTNKRTWRSETTAVSAHSTHSPYAAPSRAASAARSMLSTLSAPSDMSSRASQTQDDPEAATTPIGCATLAEHIDACIMEASCTMEAQLMLDAGRYGNAEDAAAPAHRAEPPRQPRPARRASRVGLWGWVMRWGRQQAALRGDLESGGGCVPVSSSSAERGAIRPPRGLWATLGLARSSPQQPQQPAPPPGERAPPSQLSAFAADLQRYCVAV